MNKKIVYFPAVKEVVKPFLVSKHETIVDTKPSSCNYRIINGWQLSTVVFCSTERSQINRRHDHFVCRESRSFLTRGIFQQSTKLTEEFAGTTR